jgi:[protein-PII] uridylyltransferase
VRTPAALRKLYLLTFGDMCATNPKLWTSWHDMLMGELYVRAVDVFERRLYVEQGESDRAGRVRERLRQRMGSQGGPALDRFLRDMPDRYFLTTAETDLGEHFELVRRHEEEPVVTRIAHFPERELTTFVVVTRDQPGLFSRITGVLASQGLNVLGAEIYTGANGIVLDEFRISHQEDDPIARDNERWERVQVTVAKVIAGELDVEQLVAQANRPSTLPQRVVPRVRTTVDIDNQVSDRFTVIDVYTQDRVGILFAITNALYHLDLSIHLAKITTNVDAVFDVFYVSDAAGQKITDPERLAHIQASVLHAAQPVPVGEAVRAQ